MCWQVSSQFDLHLVYTLPCGHDGVVGEIIVLGFVVSVMLVKIFHGDLEVIVGPKNIFSAVDNVSCDLVEAFALAVLGNDTVVACGIEAVSAVLGNEIVVVSGGENISVVPVDDIVVSAGDDVSAALEDDIVVSGGEEFLAVLGSVIVVCDDENV